MVSEERESIKKAVKDVLRGGRAKVVFTKLDGTRREMLCTLNKDILSERGVVLGESAKPSRRLNESVVCAYDLEKDGWRSFRLDSIESCVPAGA